MSKSQSNKDLNKIYAKTWFPINPSKKWQNWETDYLIDKNTQQLQQIYKYASHTIWEKAN